ncbi:MAG: hypothetical protein ACRC7G_13475, partial [Beijerinckiaceae bacterium]
MPALERHLAGDERDVVAGEALCDRLGLSPQRIAALRVAATDQALSFRQTLRAATDVPDKAATEAFAIADGLPVVDLSLDLPDGTLAPDGAIDVCLLHRVIPWREKGGILLIAAAHVDPATARACRSAFGTEIAFVAAPGTAILDAIQARYGAALTARAVDELSLARPDLSARKTLTLAQVVLIYSLTTALLVAVWVAPLMTLIVINAVMTIFYLG